MIVSSDGAGGKLHSLARDDLIAGVPRHKQPNESIPNVKMGKENNEVNVCIFFLN